MVKQQGVIRRSRGDIVFDTVNTVLMTLFLLIMAFPLYYTIIASVSDVNELGLGNVFLWPRGFTLNAYKNVFINNSIWAGYRNTLFYTVCGTLYQLVVMVPLAYGLSKKKLFGKRVVTWYFLFTMYFSGGIVPTYLLMSQIGFVNNPLVMIVTGISVYNMLVTRTFFSNSIPEELYESAKIDGANEFRCFFQIALPLSSAILAVMTLYHAVGIWNAYFAAMIYLTKTALFPLQLVLRSILIKNQAMMTNPDFFATMSSDEQMLVVEQARMAETMKYALIFIGSAPLLIAYPFVQKFFVKGVMLGSIKG